MSKYSFKTFIGSVHKKFMDWLSANKRIICKWLGRIVFVVAKILLEKVISHFIEF